MPVLKTRTFTHCERTFDIQAELHDIDPSHLEAVVYEGGGLAELPYPGGRTVIPTYAVTFEQPIDSGDAAAIDTLIATAEADFRRLIR